MAVPILKMVLLLNGHEHNTFLHRHHVPSLFVGQSRRGSMKINQINNSASAGNESQPLLSEIGTERVKELQEIKTAEEPEIKLADTWRKLHGEDDWVGMLDPFHPLLRSELTRYGEMAQACYDAFDFDPFSIYCGSCKFSPGKFFQSLGLTQHGYEVTCYLHATCNINFPSFFKRSLRSEKWSQAANWIGFVAVSNDETSAHLGRRDITIAWRGTVTRLEWLADFMYFLRPIKVRMIPCPDPRVEVETGFLHLYTDRNRNCPFSKYSAREQVLTEVKRLMQQHKGEKLSITITGHSLGSALAILNAYDIAETGVEIMDDGQAAPICVFSFSGPRVGNIRFKERIDKLGVKVLRVRNVHDQVPLAPGIFFNERVPSTLQKLAERFSWWYSHVGVELALNHKDSPFLKETNDLACFHNLEAHLHLIDGYHGKGRKFVLANGRDIALVNKATDFLKDHYLVPPNWWQRENKGLVQNHKGHWIQLERQDLEDHLKKYAPTSRHWE
ncbi:Alpha/beta-Hydrolases superfamily protein, putative [Theobroma cacao]|uniref:Alpha/beta-Hydrolases superfamily protein, putative n=1 Tax=Theobroma cacao TaxID=3641 RepID=A0A061ELF6_THECC|nr:Alpha/beta-Hydrolases superfamily protein, putative [Theobroma cacao]